MSYDPTSTDSMFTKIMERLDKQDRILERIESQTIKTNGRVTKLEEEQWKQRGAVAVVALGAMALWQWLLKHW